MPLAAARGLDGTRIGTAHKQYLALIKDLIFFSGLDHPLHHTRVRDRSNDGQDGLRDAARQLGGERPVRDRRELDLEKGVGSGGGAIEPSGWQVRFGRGLPFSRAEGDIEESGDGPGRAMTTRMPRRGRLGKGLSSM